VKLGPHYLHALFYLDRVGNRSNPTEWPFSLIFVGFFGCNRGHSLECDAIGLYSYLPNMLLKRDCSIRVRIEILNLCETKFKSCDISTYFHLGTYAGQFLTLKRCSPGPLKPFFLFLSCWSYVKSVCLFIYLFIYLFFYSLQVLLAVNEFNGFFLKTSFMDAKQKYVCLHLAVFIV